MDEKKKKALQQLHVELVNGMNPEAMKDALFAKELLTRDEFERTGLLYMTVRDKNVFILQRIPTKGKDAFDLFVDCLQDTSQENPSHRELYSKLIQKLEALSQNYSA